MSKAGVALIIFYKSFDPSVIPRVNKITYKYITSFNACKGEGKKKNQNDTPDLSENV